MKYLTKRTAALSTLGIILVVLLVLFLCGGGYAGSWALASPAVVILVVLLILVLTGNL